MDIRDLRFSEYTVGTDPTVYKTVMNHNQNDGLLKMIRRTDPMILKLIIIITK